MSVSEILTNRNLHQTTWSQGVEELVIRNDILEMQDRDHIVVGISLLIIHISNGGVFSSCHFSAMAFPECCVVVFTHLKTIMRLQLDNILRLDSY